jgi:trehalose synthase
MALSPEDADYVVSQFGVDPEPPLILQVSRFDPWKDPLGVIDAYRMVKKEFASVKLALVGSMATDDPEGWTFFTQTVEHAGDDSDVLILSNLNNVGNLEVNAFQSRADVVIQKSIREGFGLTVSEALWKVKPTIGGNVGGIPAQIIDEKTGFLVDSAEQCAERCMWILDHPEEARGLGRAGKEHVRANFLMPRVLRDYLKLLTELKG